MAKGEARFLGADAYIPGALMGKKHPNQNTCTSRTSICRPPADAAIRHQCGPALPSTNLIPRWHHRKARSSQRGTLLDGAVLKTHPPGPRALLATCVL